MSMKQAEPWVENPIPQLLAFVRSALQTGVTADQSPDLAKRIELCNRISLLGSTIMFVWAAVEAQIGDRSNLGLELGLGIAFAASLILNANRCYRAGRLLLIAVANLTVFAGAVMFKKGSGGELPFLGLVGLPLLLFRPDERRSLGVGVAIGVVLFVVCEAGGGERLVGLVPKEAPSWYFGANAATTFLEAFLLPLFFYRSNRRAEAELDRIGRERLSRLIDSNLIGVARGVVGGPIVEANDALLTMLGYTRDELRSGQLKLEAMTPPEYVDESRRALSLLKEESVSPVYEKEYMRKDGTRIPVLIGMTLLDRHSSEAVGFVLDITARKRAAEKDALLRETQEEVRAREVFSSIASHELRTPLAGLMLQMELAARAEERAGRNDSVVMPHLRRCQASAKKMSVLIDTLLDVTRIARGALQLTVSEMDLAQAARNAVSGLEASGVGLPGQISVKAPLPVNGKWDALRIDQVFTNLVSNALKYGRDRPIEVRVSHDMAVDRARVEVVDQGMGIERSMLERIFDPFQRAVAGGERIQGLGLGLYVVRSIVESHGGTIHVDSERGVGSRFAVELPRRAMAIQ
jgi:PAS domain S-box-containing protein